MNIIEKGIKTTTFGNIYYGDVFTISTDHRYFMVTEVVNTASGGVYNCVALDNGEMNFMGNDEAVLKVDCDLVIK